MNEFLYRYVDIQYAAPVDEFDNVIGVGRLEIRLIEYPVLKTTPRGVWVDLGAGEKRFVLDGARRCFACRTKELALESYRARKRRQIQILSARLRRAEAALRKADGDPFKLN